MINFKKLEKNDFNDINKYLLLDKTRSCEKIASALMMWRDFYKIEWAIYENTLIVKYGIDDGVAAYMMPVGENVEAVAKALGNATYVGVCKEDIEKIALPNAEITPNRDNFDYIYLAEALATFKGKALHAKKNFLNRFKKTYNYEFTTTPNKKELIEFFKEMDIKYPHSDETGSAELDETIDLIENSELFKLLMGAIKIDGKIIAATIGTRVDDTLYVQIEKADREYIGAYPAIVSEFVSSVDGITYVNREDDLGNEGLRQSKISYKPLYLLEKYVVKNKGL